MKSIIRNQEQTKELTYPCLKEFSNGNGSYVVLFYKPETGIVVFSNHSHWEIGSGEGEEFQEEYFKPFNGNIELSN